MFNWPVRQRRKNCDRWVFLHIPKNAGRWIQMIIPELNGSLGAEIFSGIPQHYLYRYYGKSGLKGDINYGGLRKAFKSHNLSDAYTFCSIRDPFQWYLSFYIWSHAVDPDTFVKKGLVPCYGTFEEFILDNKVTYIGAVRPHLNACNGYVRLASLRDDFEYLISRTFPERLCSFNGAVFEKGYYNNLSDIPNEKQRKALEDSELKARFRAYIEGKETDCFYTEEMKATVRRRDALVFRMLESERPVVLLDRKLSGLPSTGIELPEYTQSCAD